MAYGKIKMGNAKPMPINVDDLRNRSKKPPKPGMGKTLPPRGPVKPRNPAPGDDRRMIDPPGEDRRRRRTTPPNIVKPTTPKFRPKLTKGAR